MKNFSNYCGLTLLILIVIMFLPFIQALPDPFSSSSSMLFGALRTKDYTGIEKWEYFLIPLSITIGVFALSFARTIWTALLGVTVSFGFVLYTFILPEFMTPETIEMLSGYSYLLALAGMFFLLNVSHTVQMARKNAIENTIKQKENSDILDDNL